MEEKNYLISESELRDLLNAYYTLAALEAGGVDNWSWYSESISDFKRNYIESNPEIKNFAEDSDYIYMEDIVDYEIANCYDEVK